VTGLPLGILRSIKITLPDYSGYLCLLSMDDDAVECPRCADGRALGLAILKQMMPSGAWVYSCLGCAGELAEIAA
jgi:hypothetical protein